MIIITSVFWIAHVLDQMHLMAQSLEQRAKISLPLFFNG